MINLMLKSGEIIYPEIIRYPDGTFKIDLELSGVSQNDYFRAIPNLLPVSSLKAFSIRSLCPAPSIT